MEKTKQFTPENSLAEIMKEAGPVMHLFFADSLIAFIPEELRKVPLKEWADSFMMPWGMPFPAEDFVSDANLVAEGEKYWDLVPLWAGSEDYTIDSNDIHSSALMILKDQPKEVRPAVIVCPGGGYENLAFSAEGVKTAQRLIKGGLKAFILNYRFHPNRYPDPQTDLAMAILHVRANADLYGIDPDNLMILGYSAGGHLCASTAALREEIRENLMKVMEERRPDLAEKYRDISVRPDKVCLCYPVISFLSEQHEPSFQALTGGDENQREHLSIEKQVDPDYPTTFVWTCADDSLVPPSNAVRMGKALEEKGIPSMLKVYPQGEHGCSLGEGTSAAGWVDEMLSFMYL